MSRRRVKFGVVAHVTNFLFWHREHSSFSRVVVKEYPRSSAWWSGARIIDAVEVEDCADCVPAVAAVMFGSRVAVESWSDTVFLSLSARRTHDYAKNSSYCPWERLTSTCTSVEPFAPRHWIDLLVFFLTFRLQQSRNWSLQKLLRAARAREVSSTDFGSLSGSGMVLYGMVWTH